MGVLRFPNPGSDIRRFAAVLRTIYKSIGEDKVFTHDDGKDAMIHSGHASSSGAIGEEAIRRSTRQNRSLDPLYNQHKMYSELYRMLGWYEPAEMNTKFKLTDLSYYVDCSENDPNIEKGLIEEGLIGICFPNFLVNNRGGNQLRYFYFLLFMMEQLGGLMYRDEIILSIHTLMNDRPLDDALKSQINLVNTLRGSLKNVDEGMQNLMHSSGIKTNTLMNYTRFPLGALQFTGWAKPVLNRNLYGQAVRCYQLTDYGRAKLDILRSLRDIRYNDISEYDYKVQAAFTLLSNYAFLKRAGFNIEDEEVKKVITRAKEICKNVLENLGVFDTNTILYSPIQQGPQELYKAAFTLYDELKA
ncbi:hypothetical protein ACFPMF_27770 [Larkinella bovis]|uniref:Uncharacterized protein n=1 Tax=Larkinella bovis TaxID=683041 RepID=A0ABW0IIE8_9BACT